METRIADKRDGGHRQRHVHLTLVTALQIDGGVQQSKQQESVTNVLDRIRLDHRDAVLA